MTSPTTIFARRHCRAMRTTLIFILRHTLHLLVPRRCAGICRWINNVLEAGWNSGCWGAGEASMRTTTKTKTAVAAPINAPHRRRTAEGARAIGRTARGALCIVADESHRIVCHLVSGDHEDGWRAGCDTDFDYDDELDNIDVDRARTANRYSAATANRTEDATWALEWGLVRCIRSCPEGG